MSRLNLCMMSVFILGLASCSPVKLPETNQYQLTAFSAKRITSSHHAATLAVTAPEAAAGYQTRQMLYIKKPYQLEAFAKNSWSSPPADMLQPLIVQSIQSTGYFYAVTSSLYSEKANYRLDTQLIKLDQNFLKNPSVLELTAKVVLTHIDNNHIIASKIIHLNIPCSQNSPYGGVVAANKAAYQLTAIISDFVVRNAK